MKFHLWYDDIIIPNNIIIVDLKTGSGTIKGQEIGEWKIL